MIDAVGAALAGRPVPLLVGSFVPRHYVLALRADGDGWRVYEPTSGQVRLLDLAAVRERVWRRARFDRLHAVLLRPDRGPENAQCACETAQLA